MYTIQGTVKSVSPLLIVGAKKHRKKNFVISSDGQYPQLLEFEIFGKSVDELPTIREGDYIEIGFIILGKEYNGRYYTTLSAKEINILK